MILPRAFQSRPGLLEEVLYCFLSLFFAKCTVLYLVCQLSSENEETLERAKNKQIKSKMNDYFDFRCALRLVKKKTRAMFSHQLAQDTDSRIAGRIQDQKFMPLSNFLHL